MANAIITQPASTPRLINKGLYMVDSRTTTLVAYEVSNQEHGWECNCPAAAYRRTCWHVTAVLALEAATEAPELEQDLVAITEHLHLAEEEGRKQWSPNYSDGTPKPYGPNDSYLQMVRKAQDSWNWD
jgi:hypothetical protein